MSELTRPELVSSEIIVAQISDCHLFADVNSCHHGANVYQHLLAVLADIKNNTSIELVIFTGDLSQDHTEQSYQNFVKAIKTQQLSVPVYFLSGNHDETALLNKYLSDVPFCADKIVKLAHWQLLLLNSKSATPAGYFNELEFQSLLATATPEKHSLVFMHHHPIDLGYFIDRHHLTNSDNFWQVIKNQAQIKAVACGHVHRAQTLLPEQTGKAVPLYTCPATSIQFDPKADTVKSLNQPPAYRIFSLQASGQIDTCIKQVADCSITTPVSISTDTSASEN